MPTPQVLTLNPLKLLASLCKEEGGQRKVEISGYVKRRFGIHTTATAVFGSRAWLEGVKILKKLNAEVCCINHIQHETGGKLQTVGTSEKNRFQRKTPIVLLPDQISRPTQCWRLRGPVVITKIVHLLTSKGIVGAILCFLLFILVRRLSLTGLGFRQQQNIFVQSLVQHPLQIQEKLFDQIFFFK